VLGPVFRTYEPARDRLVAVKVFRLDLTPEQAQALAEDLRRLVDLDLDHPSIVRPVAAGVEGSSAYLATEYVAAESLDIALRHYAPAGMDKVLPFITQLAGAIDFARTAGVSHGALHPRDIFVTPEEARATGFGVVQALERLGVRAPTRRPYTAPERVGSDPGSPWDVRADGYSLAAIAYELITGKRPVGPDVGDLGESAGPYAGQVASALARGLSEEPDHRYDSALAFAAALEAASRGERTTAAIEQVRAVAGLGALSAPPESPGSSVEEGEPAFHIEPELEFDRDALDAELDVIDAAGDREIERDDDLADIQLREEEALLREAEDDHPAREAEPPAEREPGPGMYGFAPLPRDQEPERPAESTPDIGEDFAWNERQAEPPLLDFGTAADPEPAPERFLLEPDRGAGRRESFASGRAREGRPTGSVLLPVALTLLLGLFVGFLSGYLVGSREPAVLIEESGGAAVEGSPLPGDTTRSSDESTANPQAQAPVSGLPAAARPPTDAPTARTETGSRDAPATPRSRLVVRSTPTGAQVYLDGRRRGTTPLTLSALAPGTYTIRVTRSGYQEETQRVAIPGGGTRDLTFRLERTPSRAPARPPASSETFTGSIYVDSRPRGATVLLNGREVGTTPLQLSEIRAGSHVIRLELPGHQTWTSSTRVVAGQVARVTGSLELQP
jgi:hypothetical protein